MKKLIALTLALALLIGGCGGGGVTSGDSTAPHITPAKIDRLFEENLYCVKYLFVLSTLPYADDPVQGENIYPVMSDRFDSYASLEAYLRTVYTDAEVARLLDKDGDPIYTEVDGKLCVNTKRIGGKPYPVDWNGHSIEIDSRDENGCTFTAVGKYIDDSADVGPAPYRAEGRAVYENGRLLLSEMII